MFGILFFFIAFCAWLAKQSDEHDKYYADYKKMGMDKYGCWKDGHNGWHWGNKELANFIIAGHNVAAVPDHLSYYQYDFHKWKYIVRDFTLEEEIQREVAEIKGFYADMAAKQKAVEEGKKYYKTTLGKSNSYKNLYRRVDNNRLYELTCLKTTFMGVMYSIYMEYYVIDLLSSKINKNDEMTYSLVKKENELITTLHSYGEKINYKEWGELDLID